MVNGPAAPDDLDGVRVGSSSAVTPHNRAVYEAGKKILIDSIETGRTFCQFMISISAGAVPVYLGLLKFVLPDKYTLSFQEGALAIVPPILFLASSIIFVFGYYPQHGYFSLDIPEEIERERTTTINKRRKLTFLGFCVFLIGNLAGIFILVPFLGKSNPDSPAMQNTSRMEWIARLGPFDDADATLSEASIDGFNLQITKLFVSASTDSLCAIYVIGRADKRPLRPSRALVYGSNDNLARARALYAKRLILTRCKNPESVERKIILLASGADNIGTIVGPILLSSDRVVDIYALWNSVTRK